MNRQVVGLALTLGSQSSNEDMDYFFFGTMRDRDVFELVVGRRVADADMEPAALPGYRLARAIDESYPALLPHAGGRIEGVLVHRLSAAEVERIMWFEGKEYASQTVEVVLRGGARAPALIYVPTEVLEIAEEDWDFDLWQRMEKDLLMTLVSGHMKLLGQVSQDEAIGVWDETREKLQAEQAKRPCRKE